MRPFSRSATLRVLQSVRGPSTTTNPYVRLLVEHLGELDQPGAAALAVHWFSWRRALLGRYQVLHVHWPEVMLRRPRRLSRWWVRCCFALLVGRLGLAQLGLGRLRVVRTLHNLASHESGDLVERVLLALLDRCTAQWIVLNPSSVPPRSGPVTLIPHGDYRRWFADHPVPTVLPGRLACVGLIRPYKGVDTLLAAFAGLTAVRCPGLSLRIVGRADDPALRQTIARAAQQDTRITTHLAHVDDEQLVREIGQAQLVVLPYRAMHNSGAALLALSLGRPVLVPDGPVTQALALEVGAGWVHRFRGRLDPAQLAQAVAASARLPVAAPDLAGRRWSDAAPAHLSVYRQVAGTPGDRVITVQYKRLSVRS